MSAISIYEDFEPATVHLKKRCEWSVENFQTVAGYKAESPEFRFAFCPEIIWQIVLSSVHQEPLILFLKLRCKGPSSQKYLSAATMIHVVPENGCNGLPLPKSCPNVFVNWNCSPAPGSQETYWELWPGPTSSAIMTLGYRFTICVHFEVVEEYNCLESSFKLYAKSLYENDCSLSDLILRVGEQDFPCHKFVLGSKSEVFKRMFMSGMKEMTENVVALNDVEPPVVKAFLDFIYLEKFDQVHTEKLFYLADKYLIENLKAHCCDTLAKEINVGTVFYVITLADRHTCVQLKESCLNFIRKNLEVVVADENFAVFAENEARLLQEILLKTIS